MGMTDGKVLRATMTNLTADEKAFKKAMHDEGYIALRKREDGVWMGVQNMLFTWGLCYGLDYTGREGRYCYECIADALVALARWDGQGDPPGPWIKQKGLVERTNPARTGEPKKDE